MRHKYTFVCPRCGKTFEALVKNRKFCSTSCASSNTNHQYKLNTAERFWNQLDKSAGPDGCWIWKGVLNHGYGRTGWHGHDITCHRLAWELTNGSVPKGLCVCHTCDTPACCNPKHLWIGTFADNNADKVAKGRSARQDGEYNPMSKLTLEQVKDIRMKATVLKINRNVLAEEYHLHKMTISKIVHGKRWAF